MKDYILNLLKNSIKKTDHDGIISHWVGDLSVDDIRYVIEYIEGLEKKLKELEDMISELEVMSGRSIDSQLTNFVKEEKDEHTTIQKIKG